MVSLSVPSALAMRPMRDNGQAPTPPKRTHVYLFFILTLCGLAACDQECRPVSYGRQCSSENSFNYCVNRSNGRLGINTPKKYHITQEVCPVTRPFCGTRENSDNPDIICIGERLAVCEVPGFVRCESLDLVVECLPQEDDTLVESRGQCPPGSVCLPPDAGESNWDGGCLQIESVSF